MKWCHSLFNITPVLSLALSFIVGVIWRKVGLLRHGPHGPKSVLTPNGTCSDHRVPETVMRDNSRFAGFF